MNRSIKVALIATGLSFGLHVHAATDPRAAAVKTVTQALSCETASGKADGVIKAVRALGGKADKQTGVYLLPAPVTVFGQDVRYVSVTPDDGESTDSYIAIFKSGDIKRIATAAGLKPLADGYRRDTRSGVLSADVRDQTDVWLSCIPL